MHFYLSLHSYFFYMKWESMHHYLIIWYFIWSFQRLVDQLEKLRVHLLNTWRSLLAIKSYFYVKNYIQNTRLIKSIKKKFQQFFLFINTYIESIQVKCRLNNCVRTSAWVSIEIHNMSLNERRLPWKYLTLLTYFVLFVLVST